MDKITITAQAPFILPTHVGGKAWMTAAHNNKNFVFSWAEFHDLPQFVRVSTSEVRALALILTSDTRSLPKHGKISLCFEFMMVDRDGEEVYSKWDWSEWVPYSR